MRSTMLGACETLAREGYFAYARVAALYLESLPYEQLHMRRINIAFTRVVVFVIMNRVVSIGLHV